MVLLNSRRVNVIGLLHPIQKEETFTPLFKIFASDLLGCEIMLFMLAYARH